MKTCNSCETDKELSEFNKQTNSKDGLQSICRICQKAKYKLWQAANESRKREYGRQRYAENAEKLREESRKYRAENPDKARRSASNWRHANPDYFTASNTKRRSILASTHVEDVLISALRDRDGDNCCYCGIEMDFLPAEQWKVPANKATHEHLQPLSRGGENSYANSSLACSQCNSRKGSKTEQEYRALIAPQISA